MRWFRKSPVAVELELDPPPTAEEQLAEAERECAFSEFEFNSSVSRLRGYNIEHEQNRFSFTNDTTTYIQTLCADAERRYLENQVRKTLARRNEAWSRRARLMLEMGKIR
jgi:hypothetical protein